MARAIQSFEVELSRDEIDFLRKSYLQQAQNIAFNYVREKLKLTEEEADERIHVDDVFEDFVFDKVNGQSYHSCIGITVPVEVDVDITL